MRDSTMKTFQVAAHVAIIITAGLVCAVLIRNYLGGQPLSAPVVRDNPTPAAEQSPVATNAVQPGTKLTFTNIDWESNGQTLIVALSDKCHFCSESALFYKRLARERGQTRLVAVLPQPVEDGRKYLDSLGVKIEDVRQVSFPSVGLRATPTLILADNKGVAIDSWIGRLPADRELEVLSHLR
jgi:hypothetical protein